VIRVVLDANVYVSAAIRPEGPPGRIVGLFLRGEIDVVLSPLIVTEVLEALASPAVRKLVRGPIDPESWFEDIVFLSDMVAGDVSVSGVCDDPDDDKYIAAAIEGRARYVVTGDGRLLAVGDHEGVRIVAPRPFLDKIERKA